jgi:hypothetical protein
VIGGDHGSTHIHQLLAPNPGRDEDRLCGMGAGIRPGTALSDFHIVDLAPTAATLLGIDRPPRHPTPSPHPEEGGQHDEGDQGGQHDHQKVQE